MADWSSSGAAVVGAAERADARSQPRAPRWLDVTTLVLLPLSVLFAWYRGFRMPNIWAVTLLNVSVTDGFRRRFLVGTLLRPFALLTGFHYWFFAVVSMLVVVALVVTLCVLAVRTRLVSQRALVIGWFAFGAGGFLFDEVGYLEQVLYLLLFAALWCIRRSRLVVASILLVAAVLTHEIALFTVLPIVAYVAISQLGWKPAAKILAAPVAVNAIVVLVPAASSGAVTDLGTRLAKHADWFPRLDALALFDRSQVDNWSLYSLWDVARFLLPITLVSVVAFLVVRRLGAHNGSARPARWWLDERLLAGVAIEAPLLLTFAGWDKYRWGFLIFSNFVIVLWLWIGKTGRELDLRQSGVVLVALVVMMQWGSLHYFDRHHARALDPEAVGDFASDVGDGSVFEIPTDSLGFFGPAPTPETEPPSVPSKP